MPRNTVVESTVLSAVFLLAVALQTKFSLFSKYSINMPKRLHMFCQPRENIRSTSLGKALVSVTGVRCWRPPVIGRQVTDHCYSCSDVFVRVGGVKSHLFTIDNGLRQVCVLSPLLFTVFIDSAFRVTTTSTRVSLVESAWSIVCFLRMNTVLLVSSEQGLQYALDWFSSACNQEGMKIALKLPKYYISPESQVSARCK